MSMRRCRGCKNMVSAESPECPICGRSHRTMGAVAAAKWVVLLGCCVWAVERLALRSGGTANAQPGAGAQALVESAASR